MSFSSRLSSRTVSDSPSKTPNRTPKKRPGEPSRWLHSSTAPNPELPLEYWENYFVAECRARSSSPSNRELNDWCMQLVEAKFQRLQLGFRGNKDLAREWREYYKNHLIQEFPNPVSDEPGWMAAATMRPIDNTGYHSADYMANDQWNSHMEDYGIPSSNIDAMPPIDYSAAEQSSRYDLTASPYKYAKKRREIYSPGESSYGTRFSASPVTEAGTQFIKTEDDDDGRSLLYCNRSQSIKAGGVKDQRSVLSMNPSPHPSARSSRPLPACDENGNIAQYDPDVYHGATLLTKIQRGIPF